MMKGLSQVFRAATGGDDFLDPLSLFVQQAAAAQENAASYGYSFDESSSAPHSTDGTNCGGRNSKDEETSRVSLCDLSEYVAVQRPTNDPNSTIQGPLVSDDSRSTIENASGLHNSTSNAGRTTTSNGGASTPVLLTNPLAHPFAAVGGLLTGEVIVTTIAALYVAPPTTAPYPFQYLSTPSKEHPGTLYLSNYRILFLPGGPAGGGDDGETPPPQVLPLACIDRVDREKRIKDFVMTNVALLLTAKDARVLRIVLCSKRLHDNESVASAITQYAFPNNLRKLFCFTHRLPANLPAPHASSPSSSGSDSAINSSDIMGSRRYAASGAGESGGGVYSFEREIARMGILRSDKWRISEANRTFHLCRTYPDRLIFPRDITDEELFSVSSFRSGQRLPTLCWGRSHGATLWRSSQPKAGVSGSCVQDERLLESIAATCELVLNQSPTAPPPANASQSGVNSGILNTDRQLFIVDCRSKTSAMANRAAGAGYESSTNYPSSRIDFFGIPNIHAVRDSLRSVWSVIQAPPGTSSVTEAAFTRAIEDTQWLANIRLILRASWETAVALARGIPTLVHCSHGWDRTAQVCALAELFVDPFYRTFDGFAVLIEKEWLSFGHPFQMRCAHGQGKGVRLEDEWSPIFLQFLDTVAQIQKAHPVAFEFNAKYLVTLAEHIYSARFGTFLCNSVYERQSYSLNENTPHVWAYLSHRRDMFASNFYDPNAYGGVFLPQFGTLVRGVSLWTDYFLRHAPLAEAMTPAVPPKLAQFVTADEPLAAAAAVATGAPDLYVPPIRSSQDILEATHRHALATAAAAAVNTPDITIQATETDGTKARLEAYHMRVSTNLAKITQRLQQLGVGSDLLAELTALQTLQPMDLSTPLPPISTLSSNNANIPAEAPKASQNEFSVQQANISSHSSPQVQKNPLSPVMNIAPATSDPMKQSSFTIGAMRPSTTVNDDPFASLLPDFLSTPTLSESVAPGVAAAANPNDTSFDDILGKFDDVLGSLPPAPSTSASLADLDRQLDSIFL